MTTCNNYQSKVTTQRQDQCIDILLDPHFQGVNKVIFQIFANIAEISFR